MNPAACTVLLTASPAAWETSHATTHNALVATKTARPAPAAWKPSIKYTTPDIPHVGTTCSVPNVIATPAIKAGRNTAAGLWRAVAALDTERKAYMLTARCSSPVCTNM